MKLHEITDGHIKSLASFNGISSEDVDEIRRKDGDWCILYWKSTRNSGRVFVSNEEVYFSDDDGKEFASFLEIQFLLDLGYEIFTKKENNMTEEKGNTIQLMSLQHKSIKQINKEVDEAIQELYDRFPDCAYANLHITVEIYPESGDYE